MEQKTRREYINKIYREKNKVKLALHTKTYNLNLQLTNPEEYQRLKLKKLEYSKKYNKAMSDEKKTLIKEKYKGKYKMTPEKRKIYTDRYKTKLKNKKILLSHMTETTNDKDTSQSPEDEIFKF